MNNNKFVIFTLNSNARWTQRPIVKLPTRITTEPKRFFITSVHSFQHLAKLSSSSLKTTPLRQEQKPLLTRIITQKHSRQTPETDHNSRTHPIRLQTRFASCSTTSFVVFEPLQRPITLLCNSFKPGSLNLSTKTTSIDKSLTAFNDSKDGTRLSALILHV